jgi:hypothetical protein
MPDPAVPVFAQTRTQAPPNREGFSTRLHRQHVFHVRGIEESEKAPNFTKRMLRRVAVTDGVADRTPILRAS